MPGLCQGRDAEPVGIGVPVVNGAIGDYEHERGEDTVHVSNQAS